MADLLTEQVAGAGGVPAEDACQPFPVAIGLQGPPIGQDALPGIGHAEVRAGHGADRAPNGIVARGVGGNGLPGGQMLRLMRIQAQQGNGGTGDLRLDGDNEIGVDPTLFRIVVPVNLAVGDKGIGMGLNAGQQRRECSIAIAARIG